jgi:dihydropteroate synthase
MRFSSESTGFLLNHTLNIQGVLMDLREPKVMGILNVTPDSFFDGNRYTERDAILRRVMQMVDDGASIIDVGGYSTRPGAGEVSESEEIDRVARPIGWIRREFPDVVISVDTFRGAVARAACQEGANIINDVSGGNLDAGMIPAVAELQVPYILMHMRGTPATMASHSVYENVTRDVIAELQVTVTKLVSQGIRDVIIDPGFGFAKTVDQNFKMLQNLSQFWALNRPLMVGVSRKSMIWKTLNITPEEALNGTSVLHTVALLRGASILRVHDVKEARQAVDLLKHLG